MEGNIINRLHDALGRIEMGPELLDRQDRLVVTHVLLPAVPTSLHSGTAVSEDSDHKERASFSPEGSQDALPVR